MLTREWRSNLALVCENAVLYVKAKMIANEASTGNYQQRRSFRELDGFFAHVGMARGTPVSRMGDAGGDYEFEAEFLSLVLVVRLPFPSTHSPAKLISAHVAGLRW